jgi:hypothetical protein
MPHSTKRSELASWIAERNAAFIGTSEYAELLSLLAPVSDSYLRRLLRETGIPLDPIIEGVRQGSFDELQESLERLLEVYEAGDVAKRRAVRAIVITAKDHARLAAHSRTATPERRSEKEEMVLWLLTWLENPGVFPEWVRLRRVAWDAEAIPRDRANL